MCSRCVVFFIRITLYCKCLFEFDVDRLSLQFVFITFFFGLQLFGQSFSFKRGFCRSLFGDSCIGRRV